SLLSANQDTTPAALSPFRRQNPREEPGALAALAGIWAGGQQQWQARLTRPFGRAPGSMQHCRCFCFAVVVERRRQAAYCSVDGAVSRSGLIAVFAKTGASGAAKRTYRWSSYSGCSTSATGTPG